MGNLAGRIGRQTLPLYMEIPGKICNLALPINRVPAFFRCYWPFLRVSIFQSASTCQAGELFRNQNLFEKRSPESM
jgi:hypothetical protein